jgi:hypothetical protein
VTAMPEPSRARLRREAMMVWRGESRTHRFLRARLTFLVATTLLVDAVATTLMAIFEDGSPQSGFHTFGGALFWTSAQLTTVSSQMPNPVTTPGRVIDLIIEVWAISVVATAAASLAAFFHARHMEEER